MTFSLWPGGGDAANELQDDLLRVYLDLVNVGLSDCLMPKQAGDKYRLLGSSIARVEPHCDQWSKACWMG